MIKVLRGTQYGFTLVEIAGVLLVSSVLASLGIPMAMDMKNSSQSSALQDEFAESLVQARTMAVSTGKVVSVCASENGKSCESGKWSNGWLVYSGERVVDGAEVANVKLIDSKMIENENIELSVFDESLKEVGDIRFNGQGFNLAKNKISAEVCSSQKNLSSESVIVQRSGGVKVLLREDKNTPLKTSCN